MKKWMLCIFLSITLGGVYAQDSSSYPEFARSLYEQGSYDEAIEHFRRLSYFEPEEYTHYYYLGKSYAQLQEYDKGVNFYNRAISNCTDGSISADITFELAQLHMQFKAYDYAALTLWNLRENNLYVKDRKLFYLGFIELLKNDYAEAEALFQKLSYIDSTDYEALASQLHVMEKKMKHPHPKRAKLLSALLPGLGQTYSGDVVGAANSFLLIGGLTTLFIYVQLQLSLVDAILSIYPWYQRYYIGGTDNAANAAIKRREEKRQEQTALFIGFLNQHKTNDNKK